jgi:predicted RND superfamily exporter protein
MDDMEYLDKLLNGDESIRKEFGKNSIVNIKFENKDKNKKHDYKKDREDLENKLKNR